MYINATLLVQAAHFLVAYVVLRFFVYKPIVAFIQKKDAQQLGLVSAIAAVKRKLHEEQEQFLKDSHEKQTALVHKSPDINKRIIPSVPELRAYKEIPASSISNLVNDVVHVIVDRIDHVP